MFGYKFVVTFNGFFCIEFDETLDILIQKESLFLFKVVGQLHMSTFALFTPGERSRRRNRDDRTPKKTKIFQKRQIFFIQKNFISGFTLTLKFHLL